MIRLASKITIVFVMAFWLGCGNEDGEKPHLKVVDNPYGNIYVRVTGETSFYVEFIESSPKEVRLFKEVGRSSTTIEFDRYEIGQFEIDPIERQFSFEVSGNTVTGSFEKAIADEECTAGLKPYDLQITSTSIFEFLGTYISTPRVCL